MEDFFFGKHVHVWWENFNIAFFFYLYSTNTHGRGIDWRMWTFSTRQICFLEKLHQFYMPKDKLLIGKNFFLKRKKEKKKDQLDNKFTILLLHFEAVFITFNTSNEWYAYMPRFWGIELKDKFLFVPILICFPIMLIFYFMNFLLCISL